MKKTEIIELIAKRNGCCYIAALVVYENLVKQTVENLVKLLKQDYDNKDLKNMSDNVKISMKEIGLEPQYPKHANAFCLSVYRYIKEHHKDVNVIWDTSDILGVLIFPKEDREER